MVTFVFRTNWKAFADRIKIENEKLKKKLAENEKMLNELQQGLKQENQLRWENFWNSKSSNRTIPYDKIIQIGCWKQLERRAKGQSSLSAADWICS